MANESIIYPKDYEHDQEFITKCQGIMNMIYNAEQYLGIMNMMEINNSNTSMP